MAMEMGFDEEKLKALGAAYVQDVRDGKLPGVNLMISRRGRPVLKASIGYADRVDQESAFVRSSIPAVLHDQADRFRTGTAAD